MSCLIAVYDAGPSGARILDELAPRCACEACEGSPFGPILPSERLVRFVMAPEHYNLQKRAVLPAAVTHAETIGMSLFREDHATDAEMVAAAQVRIANKRLVDPTAGIHGIIMFQAGAVKTPYLASDGYSAYCIAGTPIRNPDRPSHVDAYMRVRSASEAKSAVRRQLFDLVKLGFETLAQYRGGLLQQFGAANAP